MWHNATLLLSRFQSNVNSHYQFNVLLQKTFKITFSLPLCSWFQSPASAKTPINYTSIVKLSPRTATVIVWQNQLLNFNSITSVSCHRRTFELLCTSSAVARPCYRDTEFSVIRPSRVVSPFTKRPGLLNYPQSKHWKIYGWHFRIPI